MKKLLVVLFLFLAFTTNYSNKEFSLLDAFSGEMTIYSLEPISENYIELGTCYMSIGEPNIEVNNAHIIGESIKVYDLEVGTALKMLNAHIVKVENVDVGEVVIYAYTNKIPRTVKVNGKKVNLQIACRDEYTIIGWPLILGSF